MSGHIHANRQREINGITYICQQSWAHEYRKPYRVLSRTWSLLETDDDKITVTLRGKTRNSYTVNLKPGGLNP